MCSYSSFYLWRISAEWQQSGYGQDPAKDFQCFEKRFMVQSLCDFVLVNPTEEKGKLTPSALQAGKLQCQRELSISLHYSVRIQP